MNNKYDDEEIECDIIETFGIFAKGIKNWNKEVNLVSWNKRPAKLDIRSWQKGHVKCGKGIALTWEEAKELNKLLNKILKQKAAKPQTKTKAKKRAEVPITLEPFYDELELVFGADPTECKAARNNLLKKYHPDKNSKNTAFANRKTIKIKEAYEKIMTWWNEQRT